MGTQVARGGCQSRPSRWSISKVGVVNEERGRRTRSTALTAVRGKDTGSRTTDHTNHGPQRSRHVDPRCRTTVIARHTRCGSAQLLRRPIRAPGRAPAGAGRPAAGVRAPVRLRRDGHRMSVRTGCPDGGVATCRPGARRAGTPRRRRDAGDRPGAPGRQSRMTAARRTGGGRTSARNWGRQNTAHGRPGARIDRRPTVADGRLDLASAEGHGTVQGA